MVVEAEMFAIAVSFVISMMSSSFVSLLSFLEIDTACVIPDLDMDVDPDNVDLTLREECETQDPFEVLRFFVCFFVWMIGY